MKKPVKKAIQVDQGFPEGACLRSGNGGALNQQSGLCGGRRRHGRCIRSQDYEDDARTG